ncbi:hypothetical protein EUGRSUZ_L02859 [Eucalyptus grandis]|uniref:Uncharacterized protein n=1 Tax=Eucalyptus grandis TaxID=71139 RepID=A0AAD9T8G7_EUCGR|nr:hypothetical protein EUGRSUZ_L02859 [Eucalyptus grandis]KAK2631475.1 hypothetical protein EUGRSUZ_L02859 [Eucalyptus grandis]
MGIIREKKPKSSSSSPSSTSPCADLRAAYHNCFNRWYSEKFVKGQWQKEECVAEWQKYRACLSEHLEDKHLSRFLEAEALDSTARADLASVVDGAETNS